MTGMAAFGEWARVLLARKAVQEELVGLIVVSYFGRRSGFFATGCLVVSGFAFFCGCE